MDTNFEAAVLSRAVHLHLQEGRPQRARALVSAWCQRAPHDASPIALQSVVELASGHLNEAQALSLQAIGLDRNSSHAHAALARVHAANGRLDDAVLCARTALNFDPEATDTAQLLAQLHLRKGDEVAAKAVLREAMARNLQDASLQLMLAELLLRSGEGFDEGARICRQVCDSHPHIAAAWALLALAQAMHGDFPGGRESLLLALALEPEHPSYLLELARMYLEDRDLPTEGAAQAVELARKVLALDPREWRASVILSEALRLQRQFLTAIKVLSDAANTLHDRANLWLELARGCAAVGQLDAATQALDKAQALKVSVVPLARARFDVALRRGDFMLAWACLEDADAALRAELPRLQPLIGGPQGYAGRVVAFTADGLSHCLMFVRYVAPLAHAGIVVHLGVPEPLVPLMRRVPGMSAVVSHQSHMGADAVEPLTRAPVLLGVMDNAIPVGAYLSADPAVIEGVRMSRTSAAGPVMLLDLGEDADPGLLHQLGQWLQVNCVWVVMVRPPPAAWKSHGVLFQVLQQDDFELLTGWLTVADFVVSADVALAHLAGGMGLTAHVVLPIGHDPVWTAQGEVSPWYPTLKLYRESMQAGWGEAWPRLRTALDAGLATMARIST